MAVRPYWRGQIRISLVAFSISLTSAMKRSSQIPLHEIDRKSGLRIHHKNVTEEGAEVDRDDIVKGYDAGDNEYVLLEEDEINDLKLPSSNMLELDNFVDISSIPIQRYERPYYVLPDGKDSFEIYATIHQALLKSGKAGIGQLTMRGREELCAVIPMEKGLLLETLRYDKELNSDDDLFPGPGKKLKDDNVHLANQLIAKNSHAPHFEKFHDHYHEALLELIDAKKAHRKPRLPKAAKPSAKVVNFADALRKSLGAAGVKSSAAKSSAKPRRASHRKRAS